MSDFKMDVVKEGLIELFEHERDEALRTTKEEHQKSIDACIRLADSINKISVSEHNYEIEIEKLVLEEEDRKIKVNDYCVEQDLKKKRE